MQLDGYQPYQPKPGEQQRGKGGNEVIIPQHYYPQRHLMSRQAGKQAQRQRPLHPSPPSECSWDLLWSEGGNLCLCFLDLSVELYGAKETTIHAVANVHVWHRWLAHPHVQRLDILHKRDGTSISFEGGVSDCDVCTDGEARQLAHLITANHKVSRPFQVYYGDLMGPFTPVTLDGYKYSASRPTNTPSGMPSTC